MLTGHKTGSAVALKIWGVCYPFLRWCPGGTGLLLRQKLYPRFFAGCGRKVLFGRFINIGNPGKIHIGDKVVISDNVTIDARDCTGQEPAIILEDKVFIGSGSIVRTAAGRIILRPGGSVGSFCHIAAAGDITIGEHVLLAAFCRIGHFPGQNSEQDDVSAAAEPGGTITILPGCWLGVRSRVRPGVVVGEGTIVGAHAVVRRSLPPFAVAVGIPAEVIRDRFA